MKHSPSLPIDQAICCMTVNVNDFIMFQPHCICLKLGVRTLIRLRWQRDSWCEKPPVSCPSSTMMPDIYITLKYALWQYLDVQLVNSQLFEIEAQVTFSKSESLNHVYGHLLFKCKFGSCKYTSVDGWRIIFYHIPRYAVESNKDAGANPAVTGWKVEHTLDWSLVCHRAFTLTLTPTGNIHSQINWAVGGNWKTHRKPTQAQAEHVNSTQRASSQPRGLKHRSLTLWSKRANHCASAHICEITYLWKLNLITPE